MEEQDNIPGNHTRAAQTHDGEVLRVKLSDVVAREAWQVRAKTYEETVKTYYAIYKRDMDTLPPILVAEVNGTLLLVDGWHRLEALKLLGCETASVVLFKATEEEAQWRAASANLTHGLPLKARELRNVFKAYVKAKQHRRRGRGIKSYREMAADLGNRVSYNTVRNWMRSFYPAIFTQLSGAGADETTRWANNGPYNHTPRLTPLGAAKNHLNAALNEARAMSPKERSKLAAYASKVLAKIDSVRPWNAKEDALEDEDF